MIYAGIGIVLVSIFNAALQSESLNILVLVPGFGLIYTGIKSPKILKNYKKDKNWTISIITIST